MRARAIRWTLVATAAFASGCGNEPPPAERPADVAPPATVTASAPRTKPAADVPPMPEAELVALLKAWRAADDGAKPEAARRLLDLGAPAAEAMVALLVKSETDGADLDDESAITAADTWLFLPRFGASAVPSLLRRLSSETAQDRELGFNWLESLAASWVFSPDGPSVCRAVFERIGNDEDRSLALLVLERSRPAGRAVAADLAKLWLAADEATRSELGAVLLALGPDAARAAPLLWDELVAAAKPPDGVPPSVERCVAALTILAATGDADAARLPFLIELLDAAAPQVRAGAASVLASYGRTGTPAAKRLAELAVHEEGDVRQAAARALAVIDADDEESLIVRLTYGGEGIFENLGTSREGVEKLIALMPKLPDDAMVVVRMSLERGGVLARDDIARLFTKHASPEARVQAPWLWLCEETRPLPDDALPLLADPDPRVRAVALSCFSGIESLPAEKLAADAIALGASADAEVRENALEALAWLSARSTKAKEALLRTIADADAGSRAAAVSALRFASDEDVELLAALRAASNDAEKSVRDAATRVLDSSERIDPSAARREIPELVESLLSGCWTRSEKLARLSKFEGGIDALVAEFRARLVAGREDTSARGREVVSLAADLARYVPSVREDLVRVRDTYADESLRSEVQRALDRIAFDSSTDPGEIARSGEADSDKIAKLRTLGDTGRPWLVVVAARSHSPGAVCEHMKDLDLRAEIVAAASFVGDGEEADDRHCGAAVLAPLLPDAEALEILTKLAPNDDVRLQVVDSLEEVAKRGAGTLPAALVARVLRSADGTRDWRGYRLVQRAGTALAAIDTSLVTDLMKLRDEGSATAAAALFHVTGSVEESLPSMKAWLAHPERLDATPGWRAIGEALAKMELTAEDIAAFVPWLELAALGESDEDTNRDEPFGGDEHLRGALVHLVPALEHCGPAAAPAVPALTLVVSNWNIDSDQRASAVRALGAIGRAARPAIPDLRRAAFVSGDPAPYVDAIRRIEVAPR